MDFEDLASRLGIDNEDFRELVELFIATTQSDMEKIRQALADRNPADAGAAAHSIKGAAGNLGFEDMAKLAETMESQGKDGSLNGFDAYTSEMDGYVTRLQEKLSGD
ncbi:MAG: Hpt domain-containing protein [Desulfobacter sp.]